MPEIIPFGKYLGRSVEQVVLKDYKYFDFFINNIPIHKKSLKGRVDYIENVVNDFVSKINCVKCDQLPAKKISIYQGYDNYRSSDLGHIYCSQNCYNEDFGISEKSILYDLGFRSALSSTKSDTNALVKILAECMGLRKNRKNKEYLEDFFNNIELRSEEKQISIW